MKVTYSPKGVCSQKMEVTVNNGIIEDVKIEKGCSGNLQGLSILVIGRKAKEIIPLIENINCGNRGTSCPSQLAEALKQTLV